MIIEFIAKGIEEAFFGGNWSDAHFQKALEDVDFETAQTKVPFTENTIERLVHHLKYNNEMMKDRADGIPHAFDEVESFGVPAFTSEEQWQNLIEEMFSTAKILIQEVKNFDEEKLFEPILPGYSTAYKNFQGISEHAHYHLGQIVMIKKYLKTRE